MEESNKDLIFELPEETEVERLLSSLDCVMSNADYLRKEYGDVVKRYRAISPIIKDGITKGFTFNEVIFHDKDEDYVKPLRVAYQNPELEYSYPEFRLGVEMLAQRAGLFDRLLPRLQSTWEFLVDGVSVDGKINYDLFVCEKDGEKNLVMNVNYGNTIWFEEIPIELMDDLCDILSKVEIPEEDEEEVKAVKYDDVEMTDKTY